jgi:hypothetical protein
LAMNAEQIFGLFTKCVEVKFSEVRGSNLLRKAPVLCH